MYYLLLLLCLLCGAYSLFAIYSAWRFFSSTNSKIRPRSFQPPISILKPVCGMEANAYEHFASFCKQEYPKYQIIFGVKEADDPIVPVIHQIIQDFPERNIQLVLCEQVLGINPKISNLIHMQQAALYPFLLISDSDIAVGTTYLNDTIAYMQDEKVAMVTCPYRSLATQGLAQIGAMMDSTEYMPGVFCASLLDKVRWTLGCSVLIRKEALQDIGGMQGVADYVAEDLLLGKKAHQLGYKIILANYVVDHVVDYHSILSIIRGRIRKDRGIFTYNPWSYCSLLFTYGAALSMLLLLVNPSETLGIMVFSFIWIIQLVMSWIISVNFLKDPSAKKWFWLSPLTNCISFILWIYVFSINTVHWRGQYFKIEKDGRLIAT